MRTIEQYNDFVRRKCELGTRRLAPPKALNRPFVRPSEPREGDERVVGEALTDVPLVGHAQRLAPEAAEEAKTIEVQAQPEEVLSFTQSAARMMKRASLTEQEVRDHVAAGAVERLINTGHVKKILDARLHLHTPHAH